MGRLGSFVCLAERGLPTSREVGVRGPPLRRHLAAFGLTVALLWFFRFLHGSAYRGDAGLSNKVFADASVVLLCLILMLGPLARFVPRVRPFVPWGRELGIAMFVTASVHVMMLLPPFVEEGWLGWIDHMLDSFSGEGIVEAANAVGWLAFITAVVLAATSNDVSHRVLGRGWKFLQRQAYLLFVLAVLHTVPWLEWMNPVYVIPTEWFWYLVALVAIFQFAGFWHTVLARRGPSPPRAPSRQQFRLEGFWVGAGKWMVVVVLWGGMLLYPTVDLGSEFSEEEQLALLCERYDQLRGLPLTEIQDELMEVAPDDVGPGAPLREWLEMCEEG